MVVLLAGQSNACGGLWRHLETALRAQARVRYATYGGSSLLREAASPDAPRMYWLNEELHAPFADTVEAIGDDRVDLIWWIQGENEALYGCTEAAYLAGLIKLRENFTQLSGGERIPFLVSPIADPPGYYKYARPVLAAQYRSVGYGFVLGPEYYHLVPAGDHHLDDVGRKSFAQSAAQIISPLL